MTERSVCKNRSYRDKLEGKRLPYGTLHCVAQFEINIFYIAFQKASRSIYSAPDMSPENSMTSPGPGSSSQLGRCSAAAGGR